ncbi:MAG: indole-3-glycerol-phosphate synthase [Myxococcota bacterium]|nr:indole-3-glycerol-phosphate synthase [Myxococcota bacterium]
MDDIPGILGEIRAYKRWERDILRDAVRGELRVPPDSPWLPSADVLEQARQFLKHGGDEGGRRSLAAALEDHERLAVLAEIKRASPSAGTIASWTEPEPLAQAYADGGADAVSVLTEARFFDGRPGFVARVREVFGGPVLRKDFIEDELDFAVSAALGADAVLLIVALLGPRSTEMLRLARCYDLEVLVEVHDERELDFAMAAGAAIIGINNRNLETFQTDLAVTERLAEGIPSPVLLVAESGIKTIQDADRMRRAGADAILVGEHLARNEGKDLQQLRIHSPRGHRGT